jgi:uncharacterized protein involved in type VI secretion and phage assembly
MSTPVDILAPVVKLAGAPLKPAQLDALVSVRVELGLCVAGRATLRFTDAGYALSAAATFALGVEVAVSLPGKENLLSGHVTGVSLDQSANEHPELVVVVDDLGYRLARGLKPLTYVNSAYTDVVSKVVQAAGMTADVRGSAAMNTTNDYLLQTGTAMSFIDAIARRTGMVWWVQDKKFVMRAAGKSDAHVQLELAEGLMEFSVRASGLRPTDVSVTGWDYGQQQPVVGQKQAPTPLDAQFVSAYVGGKPGGALSASESHTAEYAATTQAEAKAVASAIYDDAESGAVIARGTCDVNPALRPGVSVKVTNAGPASGAYYVSEVEHTYSNRGFVTRFVAGPRRPTSLVDTLAQPPADPGFAVGGLVIGVVTNNEDEKNFGRVKVRFPALGAQIESTWARVVSFGAGAARGAVFQPEVNDEVLVGFEYGDSRRPVVIGGLFSPKNSLPEAGKVLGDGKVVYRRITSRKNHIIEFADGDAPSDQHVLLKLGTQEHLLRLGADAFAIQVAAGKPLTIKAGQAQFAISESGDVTIEGKNVTIKAEVALNLEGQTQATLKSNSQVGVQGTIVDVKANATANVAANASLNLKGGVVMIN